MMENIFVVIAFLSYKHMRKKTTKMLSELEKIKELHNMISGRKIRSALKLIGTGSISSQPVREIVCIFDNKITGNRAY